MVDDSDGLRLVRKIADEHARLVEDKQAQAILEAMGWVRPVRCKKCMHFIPLLNFCSLLYVSGPRQLSVSPNDYCSRGERKE